MFSKESPNYFYTVNFYHSTNLFGTKDWEYHALRHLFIYEKLNIKTYLIPDGQLKQLCLSVLKVTLENSPFLHLFFQKISRLHLMNFVLFM